MLTSAARQRDPLLLPAGQLHRATAGELAQADHLEHVERALTGLARRHLLGPQPERHVVEHGHVGEQRVLLEHRVDVALVGRHVRHVGTLEHDLATGRLLEAGDHLQQRGLAAARWPEEREELAPRDREVGPLDRDEVPELLTDPVQHDHVVVQDRHLPCSSADAEPSVGRHN